MISIENHNRIKHNESEKLRNEVEAFYANGGKRKYELKERKKPEPKHRYNTEYYIKNRELREQQKIVLNDYARSTSSKMKWKILSNATGYVVGAKTLACVNRGDTFIRNSEHWKLVLKAIEELKND